MTSAATENAGDRIDPARARAETLAHVQGNVAVDVLTNPIWACVIAGLFSGVFPFAGAAPAASVTAWLVLWSFWSLTGIALRRWQQQGPEAGATDARLMAAYRALYVAEACVWSSVLVLFWDPAAPMNSVLLLVILAGVGASMVVQATAVLDTFVMAIAVVIGSVALRFGTADAMFGGVMPWLVVAFGIWLVLLGVNAHQRFNANLVLRLRNEALVESLACANREAEAARMRAEAANLAKSTFLANMSHELRTPLNAVIGFSEFIRATSNEVRTCDYAADINAAGIHLLSIIDEILDISKIEAGKMTVTFDIVDLAQVAVEAIRVMAPRALEKNIVIRNACDPTIDIWADERAIRQVLLNLLSNAVKFTGGGGRVEVASREVGSSVEITVSDNGCGMEAAFAARAFEPFEQQDSAYTRRNGGTGLGLAIVRGLVQLHNGDCAIDSRPGDGTTVRITLPVLRQRKVA